MNEFMCDIYIGDGLNKQTPSDNNDDDDDGFLGAKFGVL